MSAYVTVLHSGEAMVSRCCIRDSAQSRTYDAEAQYTLIRFAHVSSNKHVELQRIFDLREIRSTIKASKFAYAC